MKTILYFLLLLFSAAAFAQTGPLTQPKQDASAAQLYPNAARRVDAAQLHALKYRGQSRGSSRALESIALDYDQLDELHGISQGGTYEHFIWDLNSNYDVNDTNRFALTWAVVRFDTLIDAITGLAYPRSTTDVAIDSLSIAFTHENLSGSLDTIQVSVYQWQGTAGLQVNAQEEIVNAKLFDTLIITNTSLTGGATQLGLLTVNPNLVLSYPNNRFLVGVHFYGDTINSTFTLLAGYKDLCGGACQAYPSLFELNSLWRLIAWNGGTNLTGVNGIAYNCDGDSLVGEPQECEEFPIQNFSISVNSQITAQDTPSGFYVYVAASQPNCGDNGSLTAQTFGMPGSYTYLWGTTPPQTTQTATGLAAGNYSVTVTSSNGINQVAHATLYSGCKSVIQGILFDDANNNCVLDSGESTLPNANVMASDSNSRFYGTSNANGQFSILVNATGSYTLSVSQNWFQYCTSSTTCNTTALDLPTLGDTAVADIGVTSSTAGYNLSLHPGWNSANPGFVKRYWILYHNYSAQSFNGTATVTFNYDPNLIFQSATPPASAHDTVNHVLTWTVSNVPNPYWEWADQLQSEFLIPANLSVGYELESEFNVEPTANDCDLSDNHLVYIDPVAGSLDPNAKEVLPAGGITEADSLLLYTIHFQNTGNDTTHFIILKDTLSPYLEPATVKNSAFSHPYAEFSIAEEGILTWLFNPIYLPDSATNEQASKGFISFYVKKKSGLPIGTEIENKASIYFDYNPAVVTNTVKSKLGYPDGIFTPGKTDVLVLAVPNPFSGYTTISVDGLKENFDFALFDLLGKQCDRINSIREHTFQVNRNELKAGIYFYRISVGGKTVANGKLMVQ